MDNGTYVADLQDARARGDVREKVADVLKNIESPKPHDIGDLNLEVDPEIKKVIGKKSEHYLNAFSGDQGAAGYAIHLSEQHAQRYALNLIEEMRDLTPPPDIKEAARVIDKAINNEPAKAVVTEQKKDQAPPPVEPVKGQPEHAPVVLHKKDLDPMNEAGVKVYRSRIRKRKVIVDRGEAIDVFSAAAAKAAVDIAKEKGWARVNVTGNDKIRRSVWLQASLENVKVRGYQPTDKDVKMLASMVKAEKERVTITEDKEVER